GTIVSTSDGGGVWVRQASGVSATLCAVCFADSLWGWVVGTDGTALHTTDGGVAWHPVTVPQATYVDVFFVDRLHGWLLESSRSVLRTIDGGNSWQEVRVTDLDFPLTSLFFIDSREGWVALGRLPGGLHGRQAPSLFATTDGGETWVPHVLPFAPAGNDVVFVGKEAGFLAGAEGTILRTTDGGQEWHPLMPVPARALRRVYFADHRHGWVTGDRLSLRTADGGATWQPCPYVPWLSMFSSDTLHGWALGDSVYYTADGGVTWVSLPPPVPGTPIAAFILNDSLGWISYLSPGQSLLARTSDRGRSWQINDSLPLEIRSLFFVDSCCGWAVGNRGLYADVCFTADGGVSWIEQYRGSAPYCSFEDVFFVDPVAGWAVGTARSIRTLDGGRSWEECGPFGPCVHFVTREEGWLAGYWTVDGGSTWQRLASSEEEARFFCSDLYFLDGAHGWAVGIGASIYRWVSGLNVPNEGLVRLLESFELAAYPNPCPGDMMIILTGGEGKPTALEIRNVSGRLVRRLVVPPGGTRSRAIPWDGRDERGAKCPAGVYLVGLDNDPARAKLKILLLH
ncbi:MAG: YCF48-related protein, partial [candidate division KSB1 bacterium]|nr:YCF48-related protein [candidate division KSB1 bacterium]